MTFVSYAQNFEDVMLWRALRHAGPGFYIDVGAASPDTDSVTRAFYDRGWHGINVEPVQAAARRLQAARPRDVTIQAALGEHEATLDLFEVEGTGLSTLDTSAIATYAAMGIEVRRTPVRVTTLAAVCDEHAPADVRFLKIDVEGAERAVLAGANFRACRPWIVLVEATAPMSSTETHATWEDVLTAADYRFVWFDGLNRFYVAAEHHAALAQHFRTPPNVFDNFVRSADVETTRRLVEAETRAAELHARARIAEERAEAAFLRLAKESVARATSETAAGTAAAERHLLLRDMEAARAQTQAALNLREQAEARVREAEARTRDAMGRTSEALAQTIDAVARTRDVIGRSVQRGLRWPALLIGAAPAPRAWDHVFLGGRSAEVRIRLKDSGAGTDGWVLGIFSPHPDLGAYASGPPQEPDLYLSDTAVAVPGTGEFLRDAKGRPYLRGLGLLIRYEEILYLEMDWK